MIVGSSIIIRMDWLDPNGAMIDCEHQLVRARTLSGGLIIDGKGAQRGPNLCSTARARRYLQQGCSGFLAYVADTQVRGMTTVSDVPIV